MYKARRWIRRSSRRHSHPRASLETLPAEVQLAILERLPDIRTVSALVHASPSFHHTYRSWRPHLLKNMLWDELQHDVVSFVDCRAALDASQVDLDRPQRATAVKTFLLDYQEKRGQARLNQLNSPSWPTFQQWSETANVPGFFRLRAAVSYLTTDFCRWRSTSSWSSATAPPPGQSRTRSSTTPPWEPSVTERRRIQRALYRFEIFRCLFGSTEAFMLPELEVDLVPEAKRLLTVVLRSWESEELACVVEYMYGRWAGFLEAAAAAEKKRSVGQGFARRCIRWRKPPTGRSIGEHALELHRADPDGCTALGAPHEHGPDVIDDRERLIGLGPCMLHRALTFKKRKDDRIKSWRGQLEKDLRDDKLSADYTSWVRSYKATSPTTSPGTIAAALKLNLTIHEAIYPGPATPIGRLLFRNDRDEHGPNAGYTWATADLEYLFDDRFRTALLRLHAHIMWDHERLKTWLLSRGLQSQLDYREVMRSVLAG